MVKKRKSKKYIVVTRKDLDLSIGLAKAIVHNKTISQIINEKKKVFKSKDLAIKYKRKKQGEGYIAYTKKFKVKKRKKVNGLGFGIFRIKSKTTKRRIMRKRR